MDKDLLEIQELFNTAEKNLKKIERLESEITIPAINGLRYAGYHLIKYLNFKSKKDKEYEADSAKRHCKRAIYDSLEVGILFLLKKIKLFKNDYRFIIISNIIPDYNEKNFKIEEIKKFISDINSDHREDEYKKIVEYYNELEKIESYLDSSRVELNKSIYKWRNRIIYAILTLIIAIIALIVSSNKCDDKGAKLPQKNSKTNSIDKT